MLHEVMSSRTSYNTAWDGVFIDLAISLSFFLTPFSRINFLGYPPLVLSSCCFSEGVLNFLCGFCCIHRPDLAFLSLFASLGGLHVEHFKDRKASRLRARYTRFVYCFSCRFGQAVRVQGAWLATPHACTPVLAYSDWH